MNETRWLDCTDPIGMLRFVRSNVSGRKLRLFACACCRLLWEQLSDRSSREAVEIAEQVAEGRTHPSGLLRAGRIAFQAHAESTPNRKASWVAIAPAGSDPYQAAMLTIRRFPSTVALGPASELCRCIRELFGNPFRPVTVDPALFEASDGLVQKLANGISLDRAFDRMPILADALEEVGCTDDSLLSHLRQPDDHFLGCWALDLLLGQS